MSEVRVNILLHDEVGNTIGLARECERSASQFLRGCVGEVDVGDADIARTVHKKVADGIDESDGCGGLEEHTEAIDLVVGVGIGVFGDEYALDVELIVADVEDLFDGADTLCHGCTHDGLLSSNAQSCTWDIDLVVRIGETDRQEHLYTSILFTIGGIETRSGEVGFGLWRNGIRALKIGLVQF